MDQNNKTFSEQGKKHNFLFDTSTILYFEKLYQLCGVSIFTALDELSDVTFFVCNLVLEEFIGNGQNFNPAQMMTFFNHILNAESAMHPDWKENRFIVTENGETKYIVLNKISATDYAQILLCQNHPELIGVTNDRRMLRSGMQVLQGRMIGISALLDRLTSLYPDNKRLETLKLTADKVFTKKHAFGEVVGSKK